MAEKTLKTRIQLKNETAENWEKAINFTPKQGEMIVYNYDIPRLKIGDGSTNVNSLSFLDENFVFKTTTINSKPLSSNITLTKTDLGLGNVGNFKAVSTVASQGLTDGEKSAARANIGAGTSSFSGNYNDLTNKPTIPNYSVATSSSNGLMSSSDKSKLDGIATGANKYTHPTYTTKSSGLYKITVDSLGHISDATAVTKSDITALGIPEQDTNTTYSAFKGATSSAVGGAGLVPAPAAGASNRYLRSDGTWQVPPDTNTTYGVATTSANGLMSASDKTKLDGIATGANKYTHPSYTARSSGLYKITVDATGHVSAATAVTKSDITALGIPSSNTTYTVMTGATSSSAGTSGLAPAPAAGDSNRYLRSDGTWAVPKVTTYSQATSSTLGLVKIGYVENGRNYPVELSNGQMFVNVPWQNTTYTLSSFGVTATADELNYCDGVTSSIQTQLDSKAPFSHTHTGYAPSTHTHIGSQIIGLSASRALVSNSSGQVAVSEVTSTELGYLDGVTSNIQNQLNTKVGFTIVASVTDP